MFGEKPKNSDNSANEGQVYSLLGWMTLTLQPTDAANHDKDAPKDWRDTAYEPAIIKAKEATETVETNSEDE